MILSKIIMKGTKIPKLFALTLLTLLCLSCSPEDGKPGADGNANVFVSEWKQIQFDDINAVNTSGVMIIPIENLVELVNNGTVILMYLKVITGNEFIIYSLPQGEDVNFVIINNSLYGKGLAIQFNGSNVSALQNTPNYTLQYVLIPKSNTGKSSTDFTKMTYEEVMQSVLVK